MSATMASQGGWVQLEQSDMRLALNLAKMAKEGISRATIEEKKYLIKIPRAKVRAVKKWGVEFPGHKKVIAARQRQPAMLCHNQMSGYNYCQNGKAQNPQTRWTRKGTDAPPPTRCRQQIPEPTPPLPGSPPAPTCNTSGAEPAEVFNLLGGYKYSCTARPSGQYLDIRKDTEHDTDFDPYMLTDKGLYTLYGLVMWLTFILKTQAADGAILQLITSIV
jgi:hypothetical protein